ncbi:TetR/AcrR family transcriptional regulator [Sciscionella marina]|uniref:TetR/AcrR family transcriptional regulator n=1 Tax=Sciscionella marina TaxID=508770 RepID=UPI000368DFCB|nr:TetR/AcrR family transcriptional regulator [Sciscionella marina]
MTGSHGMPEKRRAIAAAARVVFGREGYTRASVDAIATEAGVSKRTIYNHFADKEELFRAVTIEGADEVTETINTLMERHLRKILDLQEDLIAFGVDRVRAIYEFPEHYALVRALQAEVTRLPEQTLEAWTAAGPATAHQRLAPYLQAIADRGLLAFEDANKAANHFNLLTVTDVLQRTYYGALPLAESAAREIVTDGVRAFLRLYGVQNSAK